MTGRPTAPIAQTPTPATPQLSSPVTHPDPYTPRVWMSTNLILLVMLALLFVMFMFQLSHRPTYEYMTASPSDTSFDESMSELGSQGWKTESCRRATSGSGYFTTAKYECIMSRPKLGW